MQTKQQLAVNLLQEYGDTFKDSSLTLKRIKDPVLVQALMEKRIERAYASNTNFRAEMDMKRWEQAIRTAESAPYHDRYPLHRVIKHARSDLHLMSQINTAINKVMEQPWVMVGENSEISDTHTSVLEESHWLNDTLKEMLLTEFEGITLLEFGGFGAGIQMDSIPRHHINPMQGKVLFEPELFGSEGIPYREKPFDRSLLEFGSPDDLGLYTLLAREAIWKRFARVDHSRYSEHYGLAWVIGYLRSYDTGEASNFINRTRNSGSMKILAMEEGDKVDISTDNRNNPHGIYDSMIDRCNAEMSKGANGQTETTESSASSGYAQSKTHMSLLNSYTRSRMRKLQQDMNHKVLPFLNERFGLGMDGHRFEFLRFWMEKQSKYQGKIFGEETGGEGEKTALSMLREQGFFSYLAPAG